MNTAKKYGKEVLNLQLILLIYLIQRLERNLLMGVKKLGIS